MIKLFELLMQWPDAATLPASMVPVWTYRGVSGAPVRLGTQAVLVTKVRAGFLLLNVSLKCRDFPVFLHTTKSTVVKLIVFWIHDCNIVPFLHFLISYQSFSKPMEYVGSY